MRRPIQGRRPMPLAFIAMRKTHRAGASSLAISVRSGMVGTTPTRSDEATADEATLMRKGADPVKQAVVGLSG